MLELLIPPPVQMVTWAAVMWLAARFLPQFGFSIPRVDLISLALAAAGVLSAFLGIVEFRKAQTTVNPHHPTNTSTLVTGGIFRFTRNPMYLGLLLILISWAVRTANYVSLACIPLFMLYITPFQIVPEERVMREKFGSQFDEYVARTRRWF